MVINFILFVFVIVITALTVQINTNSISRLFIKIMSLYWLGVSCISLFNPYDLYEVSNFCYFLILGGIYSFILGYSVSYNKSIAFYKTSSIGSLNFDVDLFIKRPLFRGVFILCFAIILYLLKNQWSVLILLGSLSNVKVDMFELLFENNSALFFIYQVLVFPVFHISCALLSYSIVNKRWSIELIFLLLFILLFCLVGGKRAYFLIVFFYFFLNYLLVNNRYMKYIANVKKKISSTLIIALFIIAFSGMTVMTALYSGSNMDKDVVLESGGDLVSQFVTYSVGPFRAFDYSLSQGYTDDVPLQLGRTSLGGLVEYYGTAILKKFGFGVRSAREYTMERLQGEFIPIGPDETINYAYTSFIYFMYDLGIIGVFLISFFYGIFVKYSIYMMVKYKTISALCFVCFQFLACIMYLQSWSYISLYAQPFLVLCYLLNKYEIKRCRRRCLTIV